MYEERSDTMEIVQDMNYLDDGFHRSMEGSGWKEEPQRFERDRLTELSHLQDDLVNKTYKTLPGSEFTLNERGHTRHIHGGRMRDRVVRHTLCDNILTPTFERFQIYSNGASQTGKGVDFARRRFERDLHNFYLEHGNNSGYVQFVDFSKFYDNIRHDRIKEVMLPKLDEYSGWLFLKIVESFSVDVSYMSDEQFACCLDEKFNSIEYYDTVPVEKRTGEKWMEKGVDIGDQVSQNIGVFFPTRIDNYVTIVRSIGRYGRYMDDMYMIHEDKEYLKETMKGIIREASELGLFVNEKKTRLVPLSSRFTYLQRIYTLSDTGKVIKKITPKAVTRERKRIKAYKRLLDKGEMKYPAIEQAVRSWMGGNVKVMSKNQVHNMKQLYKDLYGKELRWK